MTTEIQHQIVNADGTTFTGKPGESLFSEFSSAHQRQGCKCRWGPSYCPHVRPVKADRANIVLECKPCGDKLIRMAMSNGVTL